jgi:hypothetical protein
MAFPLPFSRKDVYQVTLSMRIDHKASENGMVQNSRRLYAHLRCSEHRFLKRCGLTSPLELKAMVNAKGNSLGLNI